MIIIEFLLRTIIGIVLLVALMLTTVLLAPVHFVIMLVSGSMFAKQNLNSQWVL